MAADAIIPAASAVIGAAVGIAGTIWATHLQQRGENQRTVRLELRELIGSFWAACDRLWRAAIAAESALVSVQAYGPIRVTEDGVDWVPGQQFANDEHRKAAQVQRDAEKEAEERLALIRITFPELADSASGLVEASRRYDMTYDRHKALKAARAQALERFETEASGELAKRR